MHRLMLRSRAYYMLRFFYIVLRYWPAARTGRFGPEAWQESSYRVFKIIEDCGGQFQIDGLSNLQRTDAPVVFVANHMSTLETLVLYSIIFPRKMPVFVVKEQLFSVPFFGAYLTYTGCIGVTRRSPSEDFRQVMLRGSERLGQGYSPIIFPQATRSTVLDPSKFNSLGIKLARRGGVPVIPVAVKTDFWTTGSIMKDFGPLDRSKTIHFEFGPPLDVPGQGRHEHEQVMAFIRERLARWQAE